MGTLSNQDAATPAGPSLGQRVFSGAAWTSLGAVLVKVVNLGGHLVLGYLLVKEDFGKLAMAYTVSMLASQLANPGIGDLLIQRGGRMRRWVTPAFWMSLTFGLAAALLVLAAAPLAAKAYGTPMLARMLAVLAPVMLLAGLSVVPAAMLQLQLRFKAATAVASVHAGLSMALTILFALLGAGAYSLVLPQPIAHLVRLAMLWRLARPPVKARLQLRRWWLMFSDAAVILGSRLMDTVLAQGHFAVLGLMYSDAEVGPFFWGLTLASQGVYLAVGNLGAVLFPALARLQDEPQRHAQAALRAAGMMVMVATPVCLLQAGLAEPALRLLYHHKWDAAIPVIQLVSLSLALTAMGQVAAAYLQSRARFRTLLVLRALAAPLLLGAVVAGAWWGRSTGAAVALAGFLGLVHPLWLVLAVADAGVSRRRVLAMAIRPLILALAAVGPAVLLAHWVAPPPQQPIVRIAVTLAGALLLHGLASFFVDRARWGELISRLRSLRPRNAAE